MLLGQHESFRKPTLQKKKLSIAPTLLKPHAIQSVQHLLFLVPNIESVKGKTRNEKRKTKDKQ